MKRKNRSVVREENAEIIECNRSGGSVKLGIDVVMIKLKKRKNKI